MHLKMGAVEEDEAVVEKTREASEAVGGGWEAARFGCFLAFFCSKDSLASLNLV